MDSLPVRIKFDAMLLVRDEVQVQSMEEVKRWWRHLAPDGGRALASGRSGRLRSTERLVGECPQWVREAGQKRKMRPEARYRVAVRAAPD